MFESRLFIVFYDQNSINLDYLNFIIIHFQFFISISYQISCHHQPRYFSHMVQYLYSILYIFTSSLHSEMSTLSDITCSRVGASPSLTLFPYFQFHSRMILSFACIMVFQHKINTTQEYFMSLPRNIRKCQFVRFQNE